MIYSAVVWRVDRKTGPPSTGHGPGAYCSPTTERPPRALPRRLGRFDVDHQVVVALAHSATSAYGRASSPTRRQASAPVPRVNTSRSTRDCSVSPNGFVSNASDRNSVRGRRGFVRSPTSHVGKSPHPRPKAVARGSADSLSEPGRLQSRRHPSRGRERTSAHRSAVLRRPSRCGCRPDGTRR